ncbi:hypothetical protein GGX14DRAFT_396260 [Mycena pura]|uniref:Uncharacterized protein n=1 Tax=Mycena pura TaxID=153505 RepID=A0AAD6VEA9_9AGAR|nr:hypothetical protein GGX14DRAFT_396260 [Mycena pura]
MTYRRAVKEGAEEPSTNIIWGLGIANRNYHWFDTFECPAFHTSGTKDLDLNEIAGVGSPGRAKIKRGEVSSITGAQPVSKGAQICARLTLGILQTWGTLAFVCSAKGHWDQMECGSQHAYASVYFLGAKWVSENLASLNVRAQERNAYNVHRITPPKRRRQLLLGIAGWKNGVTSVHKWYPGSWHR